MNTRTDELQASWPDGRTPPREAFHVERVVDPFSGADAIGSVRHAGHAWCARLPAPFDPRDPRDFATAARLGARYLADLAQALALRPGRGGWLHAALWQRLQNPQRAEEPAFDWLPVTWHGPVPDVDRSPDTGPLGSLWIDREAEREDVARGTPKGQLVLLAGNVITKHQLQFGGDLGLRLVVHVDGATARVHGVVLSGLCSDRALTVVPGCLPTLLEPGGLAPIKTAIAQGLGAAGSVWIHDIEHRPGVPGGPVQLGVTGIAARMRRGGKGGAAAQPLSRARVHDFRVDVELDHGSARVRHVHRNDYLGAAMAQWYAVRSFVRDAASQTVAPTPDGPSADDAGARRASLPSGRLDRYRTPVLLHLEVAPGAAPSPCLSFSAPNAWFVTRSAGAVAPGAAGVPTVATYGGTVQLPAAPARRGAAAAEVRPLELRTDAQASVETHVRASELFARMDAYGMDPEAYFRFARLPLVQRARPAMTWAPDGDLPNAEVRPFIGDAEAGEPDAHIGRRMQLLVRYGSASPFERHKEPGVGSAHGRLKAQYLSVASDPRWAWHEFGHVLAYAGTGELELPFAHGVGDALGAIAADPLSRLAEGDPEAPERFVTFPWIQVPGRSHGRAARQGYCWCGARNGVRLDFRAPQERYRHSYFGEQLMSSSLFRLYRSLGGDTRRAPDAPPDRLLRLEASDYVIYLVMRALSLLGPDSVAPARSADQFVGALIDADLGTAGWSVDATWPFDLDPRRLRRQGGRVHKVIRWAFERQGLYATADPRATAEGPGRPPEVDVYVADRRPADGADAEPGGYAPVALRAAGTGAQPWHAHPEALRRSGRTLQLRIGNRGDRPAAGLTARAWWRASATAAWTQLPSPAALDRACTRDQPVELSFTLPAKVPAGPVWVLASADAAADPSNLPAGAAPPHAAGDLLELVAHDNNLALAWL